MAWAHKGYSENSRHFPDHKGMVRSKGGEKERWGKNMGGAKWFLPRKSSEFIIIISSVAQESTKPSHTAFAAEGLRA